MPVVSKTANRLRRLNVHNNWELLRTFGGPYDVAVTYQPAPRGRLGMAESDKSRVWSPRRHSKLELKPLYRCSEKVFVGRRRDSFPQALAWAVETFKHEFVISPFGGRVPKHVVERAKQVCDEAGV